MENEAILAQLTKVLEQNQVTIRSEALGGSGGGLCRMKGESLFFLDKDASDAENAAAAAKAIVVAISDLETIYLKPAVREFIDKHADGR